jgi:anaphase-promoting complex subunit 6
VEREQYEDALQLLGTSNPFGSGPTGSTSSTAGVQEDCIKLNSSMCHLRGLLHLRLSSVQDAKDSFIEALTIDVKNYEAFRELVEGEMMQPQEGERRPDCQAHVPRLMGRMGVCAEAGLQLAAHQRAGNVRQAHVCQPAEESELARAPIIIAHPQNGKARDIARARSELSEKHGLSDNCDVLLGLAEELYTAYKWEACYAITSKWAI